jgi:hypothetical protein
LLLFGCVAYFATLQEIAFAVDDIILENAEFSLTTTFQYPQDVPVVAGVRIVVEYGDFVVVADTRAPEGLPSHSISRVIVEYADTAVHVDLLSPEGKPNTDVSRIIVEYADYSRILDTPTFVGPQPMGNNDSRPPEIANPTRTPTDAEVPEYRDVTVSVNIIDVDGGVKNATLQYSLYNSTGWFDVPMTLNMSSYVNSLSVSYYGIISGQPNCTWVSFRVVAYDYAWNSATKDGESPYSPYHVVPEVPPTALILLLAVSSLSTIALTKRGHGRKVYLHS